MFGLFSKGLGSTITSGMSRFTGVTNFQVASPLFARFKYEYAPRFKRVRKAMKGRVPVRTGGSLRGNLLVYGQYGLRLKTNGMRMSANQLLAADKVLKREIKGSGAKLMTRFVCNTAVCVKGNQTRMGKGKGAFDHWAARITTGKVLFELRGNIHDQMAREALRKAADKLPGLYEIITPESPIRASITTCVDAPPKVNYRAELNKAPTKKWANIQEGKKDIYRMFRGR